MNITLRPTDAARALLLASLRTGTFRGLGGAGSGNFGHEGRPGEVGGSGGGVSGSTTTTGILAAIQQADGGFTYNPITGHSPTSGYALSLHKDRERVLSEMNLVTLTKYAKDNEDLLSASDNYLGGWHNPDDGKFYLDVSTVVSDAHTAERLGREHHQLAYFDLGKGQSVSLEEHHVKAAAYYRGRQEEGSYIGGSYRTVPQDDWSRTYASRDRRSAADLRTSGGVGSGNFGHAGRPGEVGGSGDAAGYDSFESQALGSGMSRTQAGIYDTSSSKNKPALTKRGNALKAKAIENHKAALKIAWDTRNKTFNTPEDVDQFVERIARTVNRGLLAPSTSLTRTFDVPKMGYIPVEHIASKMKLFTTELHQRLTNGSDAIGTSAMIEQRLSLIHPWSDGVGRTTRTVAAFALARGGERLPRYPDSKEFYSHVNRDSSTQFRAYYATLIPKKRTLGGAGSGNFGHAGRPGEIGGSSSDGGSTSDGTVRTIDQPQLDKLENDARQWVDRLDKSEKQALRNYTNNTHTAINTALRTGVSLDPVLQTDVNTLNRAIDSYKGAPPELVWRGLESHPAQASVLEGLNPGDVIQLNGFQSTTVSPARAQEWSGNRPLLEIKPIKGAYLGLISPFSDEKEFLLPHGAKYRVVGKKTIQIRMAKMDKNYNYNVAQPVIQLEMLK